MWDASCVSDSSGSKNFLDCQLDRFILWVPVCIGLGIGIYFSLSFEPPLWVLWGLLVGIAGCSLALRRIERLWPRYALGALVLSMGGFALAQYRTAWVACPMLEHSLSSAWVEGEVEDITESRGGHKMIIRVDHLSFVDHRQFIGPEEYPYKVQITHKKSLETSIIPGDRVASLTKLGPIRGPILPGTFDFRRKAFFQQIGASGIAFDVKHMASSSTSSFRVWVMRHRHHLTAAIRDLLPDQKGAIAAALITGDTAGLSPTIRHVFADTGTSHILVIAGLHMSIIAGFLFLCCRVIFGMIPWILNRYPARRLAVGLAMTGSFCYLNLSGIGIPTQRAFISFTLLMLGILWNRRPISMRSLSVAATLILCVTPESLITASFQLSFSVVAGLIAAYERTIVVGHKMIYSPPTLMRRVRRYVGGMLYSSLIASLAALPFTVYHFDTFTLQSVTGNMLAIPLMSVWIMPMALFSVLFSPWIAGQHFCLERMGEGIDVMVAIVTWCAQLPGAAIHVPHVPKVTLLMMVAGGVWLCLWHGGWRWLGVVPMALSLIPYSLHTFPCIFISDSAQVIGVYDRERLYVTTPHTTSFVPSVWAAYRGVKPFQVISCSQARVAGDPFVEKIGDSWVMKTNALWVGYARSSENALSIARSVNVLISSDPLRSLRSLCIHPNFIIDRFDVWREGGIMVYSNHGYLWYDTVRESVGDRPWAMNRDRN